MATKEKLEGAPFVVKTYQLVSDPESDSLVSWSETRDSFIVWKPVEFAAEILPKYFKHSNFCSFIRQLNTYSFHKVESKNWEFKHDLFREGQKAALKNIVRRKSKKREVEPEHEEHIGPIPNTPTPAVTTSNTISFLTPHTPSLSSPASALSPPAATPTYDHIQLNSTEHPFLVNNGPLVAELEGNTESEVEQLRKLNNQLLSEIGKLHEQQEQSQGTIRKILEELIESRREQRNLQQKVFNLSQELTLKQQDHLLSEIASSSSVDAKTDPSSFFSLSSLNGVLPQVDFARGGGAPIIPPKDDPDFNQFDFNEVELQKLGLLLNNNQPDGFFSLDDLPISVTGQLQQQNPFAPSVHHRNE